MHRGQAAYACLSHLSPPQPLLNTAQRSCTQGDKSKADSLVVTSWNIDGLTFCGENKLESPGFSDQVLNRDVIFLCETHVREQVIESSCLQGYTCLGADGVKIKGINRGRLSNGMAFLVKTALAPSSKLIRKSDFSLVLEIKLQSALDRLYIIGCYVPPENSKYYDRDAWENIRDLINEYSALGKIILIGDFNARTECMQTNHLASMPRENQDLDKNKHGLQMIAVCCETKCTILNGATLGDRMGNYKYYNSSGGAP